MKTVLLALFLGLLSTFVLSDLPNHCLFEQVAGTWTFYRTPKVFDKSVGTGACAITQSNLPSTQLDTIQLRLAMPDKAVLLKNGQQVHSGFWTLIYDEGMEIHIDGTKYFAFFNYTESRDSSGKIVYTSHCDQTFIGWFHDDVVGAKDWGCFKGYRTQKTEPVQLTSTHQEHAKKPFKTDKKFIKAINKAQKLWKATNYDFFEGKSLEEVRRLTGGKSHNLNRMNNLNKQKRVLQASAQSSEFVSIFNPKLKKREQVKAADLRAKLPKEFSWTNVNGKNYVVPVRDQGGCGSCYAFSSSDMIGSRVRILSNLTQTPFYSPQDIVDCSYYSQGCEGGFQYLVSKYSQDFGLALEQCDPYKGRDQHVCTNICPANTKRMFVSDYYYVGGFYGATTELNMMHEIATNGPVVIGFYIYNDFMHYKSGIYKHVSTDNEFGKDFPNNWEPLSHAVLVVGWGEENGTPYWLIKNSWSESWGEKGYFRILRGADECGVESDVVGALPIV
ncbi:hypothetical protein ABK040_011382 [Willaertia magna]